MTSGLREDLVMRGYTDVSQKTLSLLWIDLLVGTRLKYSQKFSSATSFSYPPLNGYPHTINAPGVCSA